jgi:hypothetical protein
MSGFRLLAIAFGTVLLPALAQPQGVADFATDAQWLAEGWQGFTDFSFLANSMLTLTLAAVLGVAIGFHPKRVRGADTLEEIEAPKVYIMNAVIGAIIGIMVVKYGLVIGFVVFGIGGLIRFRTDLRSATLTGHVIFVTLIGLCCGLNLPHVAVLATIFGFVLIYILDMRVTYRIEVNSLPAAQVVEAAASYRNLLEAQACRVVHEKRSPAKERVEFIFHCAQHVTRHDLEELFALRIDPALRGTVDWEID